MNSVAEAFETPQYFSFKELVSKSSVENSIKIKNNSIVYGKNVKEIPSFNSVQHVKDMLQKDKLFYLLALNDLYDQIVISDTPEKYKTQYDTLIKHISTIEMKIDEIDAYISNQNNMHVDEPILQIKKELEETEIKSDSIIKATKDNVHLDKNQIKTLLTLHKTHNLLLQKLEEAKTNMEMDYIIWKIEKQPSNKTSHLSVSSNTRKIYGLKKQTIKNNIKQLLKDKLS